MSACICTVEHMRHHFLRHAFSGVGNGNLNVGQISAIVLGYRSRLYCHCSVFRCEFPGVIGNGVYHEQCKCGVGFYHCISGPHYEVYASEREAHRAVTHHVEHLLQAKVLYS